MSLSAVQNQMDINRGRSVRDSKLGWYFGFFLLSGFCGLVYEVVWVRLAMAEFGVTTALVSIVLSIFMAGLGLGSWGAGVLMRRSSGRMASSTLRLYAGVEISDRLLSCLRAA